MDIGLWVMCGYLDNEWILDEHGLMLIFIKQK